jgi:hypothetical protein
LKAHPRRLEVTKDLFLENPQIGVVYSTFEIIDEKNNLTPIERITTSILEILESHTHPLEGKDVWIKMGTETGYTNLTSSTAVRVKFVSMSFPKRRSIRRFSFLVEDVDL